MENSKLILQLAHDPIEVSCGIFETDKNGWQKMFLTKGFGINLEVHEEEKEFARRLVAAYNATRHVPVETLETDPLTLDGVEDTFNRLKAQNAQLLSALKKIDGCQADGISPDDPGGWMGFFIETAHAAIAAATSTEKTETP